MISVYPLRNLKEEVSFIAYHFHWDKEKILDMTHNERKEWAKEISKINDKINKGD